MTRQLRWACFVIGILLSRTPVNAQSIGHYLQGVTGLDNGSAPPPGIYMTYMPLIEFIDSVKGPNGLSVVNTDLRETIQGVEIAAMTRKKIFGATYGAAVLLPFVSARLNSEILPSGSFKSDWAFSDTLFIPVLLGWNWKHADMTASYGFYAPTGSYDPAKLANGGLGFWEHQIQVGSTYNFDEHKTITASFLSTWEINQKKEGVNLTPGPMFTVEYGAGKKFMKGFLQLGASGYYYRKLIPDSGSDVRPIVQGLNDQALGLGPEVRLTFPVKGMTHLMQFMTRYEPQMGVESRPHGQVLTMSLTYMNIFAPK